MSDIERRLRDSLNAHAHRAPAGDDLAERIIADAAHGSVVPIQRARRVRSWTLPLIASAAVAAVAAALVGISAGGRHSASAPPATQLHSAPVLHTATPSAPTPTSAPTTPISTAASSDPSGLAGFQIIDTTFVGTTDGWALGTAECLSGRGVGCSAMVRTTDGGTSWLAVPPPPAHVPHGASSCADPCVSGLRFANDKIGYAYGPGVLFMTTDAGRSWHRQFGGADRLETLDGNVIRVSIQGCGMSCPTVQTAQIGTSVWKPAPLAGIPYGAGGFTAALARTGRNAYIWADSWAKNSDSPVVAAFYTSHDDGHTWTRRADPCSFVPNTLPGGASAAMSMAPAADGSVTVACISNGGGMNRPISMATSTDDGRTFTTTARQTMPANRGVDIVGAASSRVLFLGGPDALYRTTDGGQRWTKVVSGAASSEQSHGAGFEDGATGHWVSDSGRTIWTTRDAGANWTAYTFG
jgi:photosystem II stability/assembly factor-like uncharacterized protein